MYGYKNEAHFRAICKRFFKILFLLLVSCSAVVNPLLADPFGRSGGVRNESNIPIRVKITLENGDYLWESLSPGVSIDLFENVLGVSVHKHPSHAILSNTRIKVTVILSDGSSTTVEKMGDFVRVKPVREKVLSKAAQV